MKLVKFVVIGLGVVGDLGRAAQIHRTHLPPHFRSGIDQFADQATHPVGKLAGQAGEAPSGQLCSLLMGADQLRQDPKHRQQKPQLPGDRGLASELVYHQLLDLLVGVLDYAVVGFHRVSGVRISMQKCRTRVEYVLFNQRDHLPDRRVDVVEALVILHPQFGHGMHRIALGLYARTTLTDRRNRWVPYFSCSPDSHVSSNVGSVIPLATDLRCLENDCGQRGDPTARQMQPIL